MASEVRVNANRFWSNFEAIFFMGIRTKLRGEDKIEFKKEEKPC